MPAPILEAQCYAPGSPPQGEPVRVEIRSREFVLHRQDGRELEVPYSSVRVRGGGWRGDALLLDWQGEDGACSMSVHRPEALSTLRAQAPEALRVLLGSERRAPRRLPLPVVVGGLAFLVLVALAITLLVTQTGRLVDAAVRRIPPQWEAQLGQMTVAALAPPAKRRTGDEPARVLDEIGARLAAQVESPYTFHWYLVDDAQVNALAAPGGHVVVFTGLLREAASAEEVAGVLAHEMQHVLLRHSLRGVVQTLGWRAIVGLALGGGGELGGAAASAVEHLGALGFSRRQEAEADAEGVRLLERARIDPVGMAAFFERLAAKGGEPPALLSTHPASGARAVRIRELAADSPDVAPLGYDWQRIRAALENPGRN